MRKTIVIVLLFVILALTACGQTAPAAETPQSTPAADTPQSGGEVHVANPWREVTETEAAGLCPGALTAPEGAENVRWSVMETAEQPALVQLDFDLNGYSYTAREQMTGDMAADISGMYYTWTEQIELKLRNWGESAKSGVYYRFIGEDEWADLCVWYDTERGISYSLSITSKDLDGFDLQAIAEMLCVPTATPGRKDGERFEAVIVLEGMEETVQYEHIRNEALGFEMDYDYESFVRRSEMDRECFVSIWDDPNAPENYLEVTRSFAPAEPVAAAVRTALSQEYDLLESTRELEGAGSCICFEASELKGTGRMADHIQTVFVIPAPDGCRIATMHCAVEAAEGFGRRFLYMLNTLAVVVG